MILRSFSCICVPQKGLSGSEWSPRKVLAPASRLGQCEVLTLLCNTFSTWTGQARNPETSALPGFVFPWPRSFTFLTSQALREVLGSWQFSFLSNVQNNSMPSSHGVRYKEVEVITDTESGPALGIPQHTGTSTRSA